MTGTSVMKKTLSIIVICGLLISIISFGNAEERLTISGGNVSGSPGNEVSVSIKMENVPSTGLSSGTLLVEYDSSKFEYKAYSAGDIVYDKERDIQVNANTLGKINIIYNDESQTGDSFIKANGVFCKLNFKINGGSPSGDYDIKISQPSLFNVLIPFYTQIDQVVATTYTSGKITVSTTSTSTSTSPSTSPNITPTVTSSTSPNITPTITPTRSPNTTPASAASQSNLNASNSGSRVFDKVIKLKINDKNMTVNNKNSTVNVLPVIKNNIPMVPIQLVMGEFGNVKWDEKKRSFSISLEDRAVNIYMDKNRIEINGMSKNLENTPKFINDSAYMPLNYTAVVIGCIVEWDDSDKSILIKK